MAYWDSSLDGSDFAFDALGVIFYHLEQQLEKDSAVVLEKTFPEQSIGVLIESAALLAEAYPKCASVTFEGKNIRKYKQRFHEWYAQCSSKVPEKHRDVLYANTLAAFERLEKALRITAPIDI